MANRQATGKKAKRAPELAGRIRELLLDAMDLLDNGDKTIAELLAEECRDNPVRFLELASKYVPRNIQHTGDEGGPITYEVIRDIVDPGKLQSTDESVTTH